MLHRVPTAMALVCALALASLVQIPSAQAKDAVSIAEQYVGTNPTGLRRLWCQAFVNLIEKKAGRSGTGSNFAHSSLGYGKPVALAQAQRGDIVVLARGKRGGHSGFFRRWRPDGRAELVSGNTRGRVVGISAYARSRILGIRRPA